MTTPPLDPISESNESTVARWREGIMSFRYACRIGISAAKTIAQTVEQHERDPEDCRQPERGEDRRARERRRGSARVVRFRNSFRNHGAR